MDARIYTRVSRLVDGRSTQGQESECRTWCAANGHAVVEVYTDDGISASRYGKRRNAWEALKDDLRPGELLVAWEASRATRDLEEYVGLRNLCAERRVSLAYSGRVLDLTDGDDRFTGGLEFLLAEREAEKIRERVLRGQRLGAAAGRPHTRPPWGYQLLRRAEWELDPVEAPRIRGAVERLLAGHTQAAVYRWLMDERGQWTPASPTHMFKSLLNPTYAGLRVQRGEVIGKGTWPAIITEDQHAKLNARSRRMKATCGYSYRPGTEPLYLLSGIAICDGCGAAVKHTRLGQSGSYYVCPNGHATRDRAMMDAAVEKALFARLANVDPADHDTEDPRIAAAVAEIEKVESDLEEWTQAAMRGEVTPAAFARIEASLRSRLTELRAQAMGSEPVRVDVDDLMCNWTTWPMRRRREVIRALFTVTVTMADKGRRNGSLTIERV